MNTESLVAFKPASADGPDESGLIADAVDGNRGAFGILYRRHVRWLLPLLWRMTGGDHGAAEDLAQEAFVQAWFKLDQLNNRERFAGWLKTLAINLALADRRKLRPAGSDQALAHQESLQPPWPAADLDLETAIARLPDRARQVLVLFCIEGFSHEEIATTMKIETGTSKAQLHRARTLLKETLS
jgi:RNA polymerase sigma factor (sigma-70 family)